MKVAQAPHLAEDYIEKIMDTKIDQQAFIKAWNTGHKDPDPSYAHNTFESLMASDRELLSNRVVMGSTSDGMKAFERYMTRETELRCAKLNAFRGVSVPGDSLS